MENKISNENDDIQIIKEEKVNNENEDVNTSKENENNITTSRIPDASTINDTKPDEDNLIKEEKSKIFSEALIKAQNIKKDGNKYFTENNYALAEHHYKLGIDFTEEFVSENIIHKKYNSEIFDKILGERIFLYSNLSNCHMKSNNYKDSLETDIYIVSQLDRMWDKSYNRIIQCALRLDNIMMANFYADTFRSMFNQETLSKYNDTFKQLETRQKEEEEKMFKAQKNMPQSTNKSSNVNIKSQNVTSNNNKNIEDDKSDTKSENVSITDSKRIIKKKSNPFSLFAKFILSGFLIFGGGAILYMIFNKRFTNPIKSISSTANLNK